MKVQKLYEDQIAQKKAKIESLQRSMNRKLHDVIFIRETEIKQSILRVDAAILQNRLDFILKKKTSAIIEKRFKEHGYIFT